MADDSKLDPEEILKLEFGYAQETATQAQNDRTAIVNLYLLLVGGVGSIAAASVQPGSVLGTGLPRFAYAVVFALLAAIGFFTVFKLIRLRQAWYDSAQTMSRIKDFYLEKFPDLKPAFRWKTEFIPAPGKPWTITFNLSLLVILIDCASLAVAFHFANQWIANADLVAVFAAVLFFLWQIWFYFFQLPLSEK
jgi:hypothetical protein